TRKTFTHHRPGLDGCIDYDFIQHMPSHTEGCPDAIGRRRRPLQPKSTDVDGAGKNCRTVRAGDSVEQSPLFQAGYAGRMDEMTRKRVTWKTGPVQQQNAITFSGE